MNHLIGKLCYLATPYSHKSPIIQEDRFIYACKLAGYLIMRGVHAFSPIAHSHPINIYGHIGGGWKVWKDYDLKMLSRCDILLVAEMPEWEKSVGMQAEIDYALAAGMAIVRLSTATLASYQL